MEEHKDGDYNGNYIVRADFFGDIPSNLKLSFWLPVNRGFLFFSDKKVHYREFTKEEDLLNIEFAKIIKVKMLSLNPIKNKWTNRLRGNPYYFLCWNPFWNSFLLNITYLGPQGQPREVFFRLKTKRITADTIEILKKILFGQEH